MAMKYLKLFESWLVSEGKQAEAFDASKPDMWPVKETTVENAEEAKLSAKFLKSIFSRALDEGNRAKLDVSEPSLSSPKIGFPVSNFHANNVSQDTSLKKYNKFVTLLNDDCADVIDKYPKEGVNPLQSFPVSKASEIRKILETYIKVLTTPGRTEFEQRSSFKAVFNGKTPEFKKACIEFLNRWMKTLDKRVEDAGSKQVMSFDIYWEEENILTVVLDKTIGAGNEKSDGILDYKCKDLRTELPSYFTTKDDEGNTEYKDNEMYNTLKMQDIMSIDYTKVNLTFGMIIAWLNKWQEGESYVPALSSTGAKEYKNICATIFDGEEREFLADFKSTSFDIGGKSIKLANTKADGTIVPVLALNKVVGTVGFAFNSYKISEEGLKSLDSPDLWKALASAKKSIVIVGNTDSIGSDEINDALSEKRAKAVLDELMKNKKASSLKTKNITKRGDGKKNPLKPDNKGKDKEASALNRRVEIIIDGKPASDVLKGQL